MNGSPFGTVAFWVVIEDGGSVALAPGRRPEPDVVLTWPYPDFEAHWFGELSLEVAYMRGQVKIEGDHALVFDDLRPIRSAARRLPRPGRPANPAIVVRGQGQQPAASAPTRRGRGGRGSGSGRWR